MENETVLIIGAGASGLMAARQLAGAGKKVIVLEARNRCGGRIHTLHDESFFEYAELGAEFVHGDLPVTLKLLKDAGIALHPANAEMWHFKNGKFSREGEFAEGWDLLMKRLAELKEDISISEFLQHAFPGEQYNGLKKSVIQFASGYDTADPDRASTFALRDEWTSEDNEDQHRVKAGYGIMIKYLEEQIAAAGGRVLLNTIVKEINWQVGKVTAIAADNSVYQASKIIIALPLGVLQADKNQPASISFAPPIPKQSVAIKKMGFGAIIKILLKFDERFWEHTAGLDSKNVGFILSDEEIPTWWTQAPQHSNMLTGWLGGPPAAEKKDVPNNEVLNQSLQSLSRIFNRDAAELKDKLLAFEITNWTADPFTLGSYAYDTVEAVKSKRILNTPLNDTLFFAGEYLYEGPAMGTVEAALTSGLQVAENIIKLVP